MQEMYKPNGKTFSDEIKYWFCSEVKSEENLCPKEPTNDKGKVLYTEKKDFVGNIHATATLIIRDINLEDQSLIMFDFERSFVRYSLTTRIIVTPNTTLFPHGWNGVYMYHVFGWSGNSNIHLRKGEHALLACAALGNSISEVFMGKDGQFDVSSSDGHFLYFPQKWKYYQLLIYAISNVTEVDAGLYSCNEQGLDKIVTYEKTVVVR